MEIRWNYRDIIEVNGEGIVLQKRNFKFKVKFEECARNYANTKMVSKSRCVANRDISKLCFTFYSIPQTTIDFNFKMCILSSFMKQVSVNRFLKFQRIINEYGYSTYDLS